MYKGEKMEEHAYQRISDNIKNGNPERIVFLYGREHYLINWAINLIVKTYIDENTGIMDLSGYDGDEADEQDVLDSLATLPLASEKKVTIVRYYDARSFRDCKLFDHKDEIPDSSVLVIALFADANVKGRRGYDFSKLSYDLYEKFVKQELRHAGMKTDSRGIRMFVSASGYHNRDSEYTLYDLKNDVAKLKAYTGGNTVTADGISEVVAGDLEKNIFKLMDYISYGKKGDAIVLLHNIIRGGENSLKILSGICTHFEDLTLAVDMMERGYDDASVKKQFRSEYRYRNMKKLGNRYTKTRAKQILQRAYNLEYDIKRGLLDEETALEIFIGEI